MAVLFFWVPLGLIVYNWFGFPALLLLVSKLRKQEEEPAPIDELPHVTVAIAAWNEELHIGDKIRNCLEFEYPPDRFEVIVGTDAVTDTTDSIVRSFEDSRVKLYALDERVGKSAVINMLAEKATGEFILFTDADVRMAPEALRIAVDRFRDNTVGMVLPSYRRVNREGHSAEGIWDQYETWLKNLEGKLGAAVGVYGWAMMMRKSLFEPIPEDTINDDYVLGVISFRHRYKSVYEPRSLSWTRVESSQVEFTRKTRISRGNAQAFFRYSDVLLPKYGISAWVFFSHKYLRWITPFLLLAMLVASAISAGTPFFAVSLALQVAAYVTTPLVLVARGFWRRLLFVQYYLFTNVALLAGYWQYACGRRLKYNWMRTTRTSD